MSRSERKNQMKSPGAISVPIRAMNMSEFHPKSQGDRYDAAKNPEWATTIMPGDHVFTISAQPGSNWAGTQTSTRTSRLDCFSSFNWVEKSELKNVKYVGIAAGKAMAAGLEPDRITMCYRSGSAETRWEGDRPLPAGTTLHWRPPVTKDEIARCTDKKGAIRPMLVTNHNYTSVISWIEKPRVFKDKAQKLDYGRYLVKQILNFKTSGDQNWRFGVNAFATENSILDAGTTSGTVSKKRKAPDDDGDYGSQSVFSADNILDLTKLYSDDLDSVFCSMDESSSTADWEQQQIEYSLRVSHMNEVVGLWVDKAYRRAHEAKGGGWPETNAIVPLRSYLEQNASRISLRYAVKMEELGKAKLRSTKVGTALSHACSGQKVTLYVGPSD